MVDLPLSTRYGTTAQLKLSYNFKIGWTRTFPSAYLECFTNPSEDRNKM